MKEIPTGFLLAACAHAAHEVNRVYCIAIGEDSPQMPWEYVEEWQRMSSINGARGVLAGNGPEQSHVSWLAEKSAAGWKWGPKKDPSKKEHPCFVPYEQLPIEQRLKDDLFVDVVAVMARVLKLAMEDKES